ncbi:MAG: hypothetical protein VZS44_03590 [Bacilli bacterium]|nr:hypothetical protein [Bacilli bacterium]
MIELHTIDDEVFKCNILFTFYENNKNFIVFMDQDDDVLATYYDIDGDKLIISPITNDQDFDIVDREINRRIGTNV